MLRTESPTNISKHRKDKKVIENSQHRIMKDKLYLNNLIALCDEMTRSGMKGGAVNVVYFDSSKAFDMVSHYLLRAKLVGYGFCKWMIAGVENQLDHHAARVAINNVKRHW